MFTNIRALLLASILFMPLSSPAFADLIEMTWTGTTRFDSQDNLGLFGPVGASIPAGTSYSSTYVFDTTISFFENTTNSTQEVSGGLFFSPFRPSPLVGTTSFTLNGMTANLNGLHYAVYFRQSGQGISNISTDSIASIGGNPLFDGQVFQRANRNDNSYGLPLNMAGFFQFGAGDATDGSFSYRTRDSNGNLLASTSFNLIPLTLTVTAIPEPHSIAVFLSFACAISLRRRRTNES